MHDSMPLGRLFYLISADYYRYRGTLRGVRRWVFFFRDLLFDRGFKITFFYRVLHYFYVNRIMLPVLPLRLYYFHLQSLYSCELPYQARIGPGFYFGHVFGTVISPRCILGKNINMSHGVTLGYIVTGSREGAPVIEDNVYIGPGSKIIGGVRIGRGSAIGANAVITRDTPENAVAVGVPGKVISQRGSGDYVIRTVEDEPVSRAESSDENITADRPPLGYPSVYPELTPVKSSSAE